MGWGPLPLARLSSGRRDPVAASAEVWATEAWEGGREGCVSFTAVTADGESDKNNSGGGGTLGATIFF